MRGAALPCPPSLLIGWLGNTLNCPALAAGQVEAGHPNNPELKTQARFFREVEMSLKELEPVHNVQILANGHVNFKLLGYDIPHKSLLQLICWKCLV